MITCSQYRNVTNVYIPSRKSKEGKRFVFIRFIKVANCDNLVANLNTIYFGRFCMHANMARFQRDSYSIAKSMSKPSDMRQN